MSMSNRDAFGKPGVGCWDQINAKGRHEYVCNADQGAVDLGLAHPLIPKVKLPESWYAGGWIDCRTAYDYYGCIAANTMGPPAPKKIEGPTPIVVKGVGATMKAASCSDFATPVIYAPSSAVDTAATWMIAGIAVMHTLWAFQWWITRIERASDV